MSPHKKQLMSHVVVGYPTLADSITIVDALVSGGSSLVELQMPFSDPLADGPTIMHASDIALKNGITFDAYLTACKEVTTTHAEISFVAVIYANTLLSHGIETCITEFTRVGMYGVIVPDLPIDTPECVTLLRACSTHTLSYIPVIASTTSHERLHLYAQHSPSIVYTTQYLGVTGGMYDGHEEVPGHISRIRTEFPHTRLAMGFGIITPEDVRRVAQYADIVVVGSAFVTCIQSNTKSHKNVSKEVVKLAEKFTSALKQ